MNIEKAMFHLIQFEVFQYELHNNIRCGISRLVSSKAYCGLYTLSKKHNVSNVVASALSKLGLLGEDEVSKCFRKQLMVSVYYYEQTEYDLEIITQILDDAKIPYIPLKGSVMRKYYPEAWMRTCCDIDILIKRENTEKAIKFLCDKNFVRVKDSSVHDYTLKSPRGVCVELHYLLDTDKEFPEAERLLEMIWDYVALEKTGHYKYNMINEMFVFYHIAHMAKHFMHGGCGIRPFIDLWLLKNKMTIDFEKLHQMLAQGNLYKFYEASCALVSVWFDNTSHNIITEQMERFVLEGGVYGTASNAYMMDAAKGDGKIRSFLKLMFFSRADLEVLYPKLKDNLFLLPYYQVKRWFRVFKKEKRKLIINLMKARISVTQTETKTAKNLLSYLGFSYKNHE